MLKIDEKELKELFIELKCGNKKAFENLYTKYNCSNCIFKDI